MSEPSLPEEEPLDSLVARVADEFAERRDRGERPDPEEYAQRHPEAAELIRGVLGVMNVVGSSLAGDRKGTAREEALSGTLGDFRIVREVGRGGMGVVYEAEQISLRRKVALKVLPFAAMLDARRLARFENEARAAASLHHEHIVPVYAVGCERGVHYYAMQFIDGRTLEEAIAARRQVIEGGQGGQGANFVARPNPVTVGEGGGQRRPVAPKGATGPTGPHPGAGGPPAGRGAADTAPVVADWTEPSLSGAPYYRRAAEWGVQAALALEHAHSLGVVHRDVKPANLMVDGRGKLWVTDFGLARLADGQGVTVSGDLLGTLRYMSPEQGLGKAGVVDHRSDVYSLGVTLYELLTLRPAVDGKDRQEVLRHLAFAEPIPSRSLTADVPIDLETIVHKAMARLPEDRYASARDLADDLRLFLQDRPIRATRATAWQRLLKWARRHTGAVAAAMALLLLGLVGLGVSTALIWQEQRRTSDALEQARQEREAALAAAERAQAERQRAEHDVNRALDGVTDFTAQLYMDKPLRQRPGVDVVRRELSAKALAFLQRWVDEEGGDPHILLRKGLACRHIAHVYHCQGNLPEAEAAYRRAAVYMDRLTEENEGGPTSVLETAFTHHILGCFLYDYAGKQAEARAEFTRAVEGYERAVAVERVVKTLQSFSYFLCTCPDMSFQRPRKAVELATESIRLNPGRWRAWAMLGLAQLACGNWGAAKTALERHEALAPKGAEDVHVWFGLAQACWHLGEAGPARLWYGRALGWMERNDTPDRYVSRLRVETANLLGARPETSPGEKP